MEQALHIVTFIILLMIGTNSTFTLNYRFLAWVGMFTSGYCLYLCCLKGNIRTIPPAAQQAPFAPVTQPFY
jgi:hypothetical protein